MPQAGITLVVIKKVHQMAFLKEVLPGNRLLLRWDRREFRFSIGKISDDKCI